jgi:plasmid replication initiation protein
MGQVVQLEIFTVNAVDPPWRDNRDAMEYPFLSLQKGRTKPIKFRKGNISLAVHSPAEFGLASIWDWDLIIFAASHLNDAIEAGLKPSPRIRFVPYDCLRQLGRSTGGKDYKELAQSIRRLRVTTVITNIRLDDEAGEEQPFAWLTWYSIPKRYTRSAMTPESPDGEPDPARPWEIELPPWLYNAILRRRDILAVHPDYFRLTGGLERWLYRLARKAVPDKAEVPAIHFRMDTLHQQSGTTRPLRNFAVDIRKMAEGQPLPEYGIRIDRDGKHELVTLYRDHGKPRRLPRGFKRLSIEGKAAKAASDHPG